MSVHYKFKSALEYDTVTFDGLHISVKDLKNAIIQQKRIGKSTDFDLQVTNAQTKEVYSDENTLIPKNTSLLIARIPLVVQKAKQWEGYGGDNTPPAKMDEGGPIAKAVDLSSLDAPEDDKIKAMMSQSTQDYDPSNYIKIRGSNQMGAVPPNYRCYKCHQGGHWIKDCTFGQGADPIEIKKSTGIPRSFMVPVDGPQVQGAMMTPNGSYAVPVLDHQAYTQKGGGTATVQEPKTEIPEDLLCNICLDLLTDAVMIPCCGNSFCDECIRSILLESEDHECPDCHEKDISPGTLIPNRFLRKSVANFKNTTGYVKKPIYREKVEPKLENVNLAVKKESTPPPEPESTEKPKSEVEEKTVISEADSTEQQAKNNENINFSKEIVASEPLKSTKDLDNIPEGPPGVSPRRSPRDQPVHRVNSSKDLQSREKERTTTSLTSTTTTRLPTKHRNDSRGNSPRKTSRNLRSPNYGESVMREERSGTPTIDEPNVTPTNYNPPPNFNSSAPPPGTIPTMLGQVPPIHGPPPSISANYPPNQPPMTNFPPSQGGLPNFRLPPPGTAPHYMPPGPYSVPPRPLFDPTRPPIGAPPGFNPNFPPGARGHRDFNRRIKDRIIEDPLAEFEKILREKDTLRRKQRNMRRSYSRSRSRSYSRSPTRRRSRSPRRRSPRSRSRSFSLSRSRSRSFSGSLRGSPYRQPSPPPRRSPLPPPPSRRGPSRYRSPIRSPPRNRHPNERHRDRDYERDREEDRDYIREERFKDNTRRNRERDHRSRDRERDCYFEGFEERRQGPPPRAQHWPPRSMQDGYYPPQQQHDMPLQQGFPHNHRYPSRDYGPPFPKESPFNQPLPQTIHSIQLQPRRYPDVAPPGVDDDIAPPGVEELPFKVAQPEKRSSPRKESLEKDKSDRREDKREVAQKRDHDRSSDRKRHDKRHEKHSRTPERARNASPRRNSKSRERKSPDKHRRRRESEDDKKREHYSDDEKSKKNKDKKKHKEKKESDKRKKKDKKDKHKKDGKEKKSKEEFRQVVTKHEAVKNTVEQTEIKQDSTEKEKAVQNEKNVKQQINEVSNKKEINENVGDNNIIDNIDCQNPKKEEANKPDLYGDILEDIDSNVVDSYGKISEKIEEFQPQEILDPIDPTPKYVKTKTESSKNTPEFKEMDDEEKDVLELHTTDIDLKTELEKSDILAPVPEKSKWEVEEDGQLLTSPTEMGINDSKSDKSGKVTNEVLKRAENAIFAKAINAIRPIEIKRISSERAKLYTTEREVEKNHNQIQVTVGVTTTAEPKKVEAQPPVRLSVKERLGVKVDDTDHVINLTRRSKTISPFSKRSETGRNYALGEKRDLDEHKSRSRRSRSRRRETSRERRGNRTETKHYKQETRRIDRRQERDKKYDEKDKRYDEKKKRKRSRSRSESEDRKHRKKDKKQKKEKPKKSREESKDKEEKKDICIDKDEQKSQSISKSTSKRKPTIDEANFEPDYDLELHTDEDDEKESKKDSKKAEEDKKSSKSSTSDSESDSSSDDDRDRKKRKHKKHRKKKKKESSSSSSESDSESSDSDRDKKRKKHKKNKKKKKKSKHK